MTRRSAISVAAIVVIVAALCVLLFDLKGQVRSSAGADNGFIFTSLLTNTYRSRSEGDDNNLEYEFAYANRSASSVTIHHIGVGCRCTSVEYPDAPILPGETGKIIARYDTRLGSGSTQLLVVDLEQNDKNWHVILRIDPSRYYKEHPPAVLFSPLGLEFDPSNPSVQRKYVSFQHLPQSCSYDLKKAYIQDAPIQVHVARLETEQLLASLQQNGRLPDRMQRVQDQIVLVIRLSLPISQPVMSGHMSTKFTLVIPGSHDECTIRIPIYLSLGSANQ